METTRAVASPARPKSQWWRAVLGEFPTGVCLVTAYGSEGEPVGMVVGSFVAVSEDPPLVGFFAANTSRTLPSLIAHGSLTISVLGANHEAFCRSFASGSPDRWDAATFATSPAGGLRLSDAVAWFDAAVDSSEPHGDHTLVIARVTAFGTGSPGGDVPLLFRRAGYGTFTAPHEDYDARAFIQRLQWANIAERHISPLAARFGVELTVNTQIGDTVVTLATVEGEQALDSSERVGASHPWAAPISPIFAAWASETKRHSWEEASRHLTGTVDRVLIERQLEGVRARGYAVAGDAELTYRFLDLVNKPLTSRNDYVEVWRQIADSRMSLEGPHGVVWDNVAVVQVPVFDSFGDVALGIYAISTRDLTQHSRLAPLAEELKAHAEHISRAIQDAGDVASRTV